MNFSQFWNTFEIEIKMKIVIKKNTVSVQMVGDLLGSQIGATNLWSTIHDFDNLTIWHATSKLLETIKRETW
jgi:hypothetical protein